MIFCVFGCGREAKYQFKSGNWCCSKSPNSCPGMKVKNSESNKGIKKPSHTEEWKRENSKRFKDKTYEELYGEEKALLLKNQKSQLRRVLWEDPESKYNSKEYRSRISVRMKGIVPYEATKRAQEVNKGSSKSEETRRKLSIANKGKKRPPFSAEWLNNLGKSAIKRWKDPKYVEKQMRARDIKPNKLELKFEQFLKTYFPNEWKFVGDGYTWIAGKNPDFMNVNGKKQLIELFGDYWHRNDNPQDRIDHFKKYGFDTIVIWERELKNLELVKERITNFV